MTTPPGSTLLPPCDRNTYVSAYVVFGSPPNHGHLPWWYRWWKERQRGPTHCYAMAWLEPIAAWIGVDVHATLLEFGVVSFDLEHPAKLVSEGHRVLRVNRVVEERFYPRGLLNCVTVVKMTLGVRAAGIITPAQLLEFLLEDGAVEVTADEKPQAEGYAGRHHGAPRT